MDKNKTAGNYLYLFVLNLIICGWSWAADFGPAKVIYGHTYFSGSSKYGVIQGMNIDVLVDSNADNKKVELVINFKNGGGWQALRGAFLRKAGQGKEIWRISYNNGYSTYYEFAVKFSSSAGTYWDNNNNKNYYIKGNGEYKLFDIAAYPTDLLKVSSNGQLTGLLALNKTSGNKQVKVIYTNNDWLTRRSSEGSWGFTQGDEVWRFSKFDLYAGRVKYKFEYTIDGQKHTVDNFGEDFLLNRDIAYNEARFFKLKDMQFKGYYTNEPEYPKLAFARLPIDKIGASQWEKLSYGNPFYFNLNVGDCLNNGFIDSCADQALTFAPGKLYDLRIDQNSLEYDLKEITLPDFEYGARTTVDGFTDIYGFWLNTFDEENGFELVADNTWRIEATITGEYDNPGFKLLTFAKEGQIPWLNDANQDGYLERASTLAKNIPVPCPARYRITVSALDFAYESERISDCLPLQKYPSMHLRGTSNQWDSQAMTLIDDFTWKGTLAFDGNGDASGPDRFKFDVAGDWKTNFGDDNADNIAERSGSSIALTAGKGVYEIVFDTQSLLYSVTKISGNLPPVADASEDVIALINQDIALDGSKSYDPEGSNLQYQWSTGGTDVIEHLNYSEPGEHIITLTVTDEHGLSSSDSVLVKVTTQDWQRTVVYMYAKTVSGQDIYLRGGIDWAYARESLGIDCAAAPVEDNKWQCAIPIKHRLMADNSKRANDHFIDWYGSEPNQGDVKGSPLVWTTDHWPSHWGSAPTVEENGYGVDPENHFGMHYWKLDVDMRCDKTVDGWFELKAYMTNGVGWEANISQSDRPYVSNNHFAQCGKLNVFRFGEDEAIIKTL